MMKRSELSVVWGVAMVVILGLAFSVRVDGQEDEWKPVEEVNIEEVSERTRERAEDDLSFLKQPSVLAFKTALFLATGSFGTQSNGRVQKMELEFSGGEEVYTEAKATIEFMGYLDDSLFGERFILTMVVDEEGNWAVTSATRAAYGRADLE